MFDIGFQELVIIGVIALLVLGPKRLPEAARTAGAWIGRMRRFVASVKQDLKDELDAEDLKEFKRLQDELTRTRDMLARSSRQLGEQLDQRIGVDPDATDGSTAEEETPTSPPTEGSPTAPKQTHADAK